MKKCLKIEHGIYAICCNDNQSFHPSKVIVFHESTNYLWNILQTIKRIVRTVLNVNTEKASHKLITVHPSDTNGTMTEKGQINISKGKANTSKTKTV